MRLIVGEVGLMTYGLQVVNDTGAISLDSEYARLCVLHQSSYTSGALVTFQRVVDTQEPPLVFIGPQNNGSFIQLGVLLSGSAVLGLAPLSLPDKAIPEAFLLAHSRPSLRRPTGFKCGTLAVSRYLTLGAGRSLYSGYTKLDLHTYDVQRSGLADELVCHTFGMKLVITHG